MSSNYTGHDSNHVSLQSHSIGTEYPWTISRRGDSYWFPWNMISGEHGPKYDIGTNVRGETGYQVAERWIVQRKIDEQRANESALADKRANVERLSNDSIQPIATWNDSKAERRIAWNHDSTSDVETLVEYTFLIPNVRDSDRMEHGNKTFEWLADKLYRTFGGYSVAGSVTGTWKDSNGNELSDVSTVYRVAILQSDVCKLQRIIASCKIVFDQQTVYVARTSGHVTID